MKLLFIHQRLGNLGGAEANILLTAQELSLRGHQLELAYLERTFRNHSIWEKAFQAAHCLNADSPALALENLLQLTTPDLIYLHTISDLSMLAVLAQSDLPVVRMVHDHEMYCLRGYKYHPISRNVCERTTSLACVFPCLAQIARNRSGGFPLQWKSFLAKKREIALNQGFDRFIVYSQFSKQELVKNGFARELIDVHVPIDCDESLPVASFSSRNLLVAAGQIIRGKGFDMLLRALASVRNPFECVILGDGSHRRHCETLCAKLRLENRIHFAGYVPREALASFYIDASAFLMSSVWPEPFGMVGPEAMRYGLPVIGFDAGGIKEWLLDGENGFLVPWMDTELFASRIDQLLEDKPLARRLGAAGRTRVNGRYAVSKQVNTLEQIFSAALRKTPGANISTQLVEAVAV